MLSNELGLMVFYGIYILFLFIYIYIYIYIYCCVFNRPIGLVVRVFANGPGDLGSIPGHVIPKTLKMVLDTSLLNTQRYKVHIKGKVEQSRERSSTSHTPRCRSYWKGSLLVAMYVPTSPLSQDGTQGQSFKQSLSVWIQMFPCPRLVAISRQKFPVFPTFAHSWRDLNSGCHVHF